MTHHHKRIVCEKCGTVIAQCRCWEKKIDIPNGLCEKCKKEVKK